MCSCGCQNKQAEKTPATPPAEGKSYVCYQCNQFKEVPPTEPVPECCGKKMAEMD